MVKHAISSHLERQAGTVHCAAALRLCCGAEAHPQAFPEILFGLVMLPPAPPLCWDTQMHKASSSLERQHGELLLAWVVAEQLLQL